MSAPITTPFGHAIPPAPRHSVTVHMPGWAAAERFAYDVGSLVASFKNAYPRMKPHPDITSLSQAVLGRLGTADRDCYLFSSLQSARECVEYSTSSARDNGTDKQPVALDQISIRCFTAKDLFYAVIFPLPQSATVAGFWSSPGAGLSSRFAEANLACLECLTQVAVPDSETPRPRFDGAVHHLLRERIISYLERAPCSLAQPSPTTGDVYLFQSGMAAIYKPHSYMLSLYHGTTVLFGMAFTNTVTLFGELGPGLKFFPRGIDEDLSDLEAFLQDERVHGRKVQAIWAEFPANPSLITPNLVRLRSLADEYDIVLAIDDTIGSWANIDITSKVDILVTSLTKSFNGYADVIAGSAILNPSSAKYRDLKPLFDRHYVPELYADDVETIERNSRDYLTRAAILNANASALAQYFAQCAKDPSNAVVRALYPSVNASGKYYTQVMRSETTHFKPGYGSLLSVEFCDLATTRAFYEELNVHKGPHQGAPLTLAVPYNVCVYGKRLDWAIEHGYKPTQIRIAVGLEDTNTLLEDFRIAVVAANQAKGQAE
ncbi:hypothetical protein CDD81_5864 [Ophiocordyceps australis]|uniref:Cystathionine gamma-synthase n=1 Tax=Ophiocordyceps australis TaxID=1399860 RepID=A0A2C5YHG0_9HYPO|nr:hypothetical protein CDD81_5864 [Ophiocordyceps australis]